MGGDTGSDSDADTDRAAHRSPKGCGSGSTTFYWAGASGAGSKPMAAFLPFASRQHVDGPVKVHLEPGKRKTFSTICIAPCYYDRIFGRKSTLTESRVGVDATAVARLFGGCTLRSAAVSGMVWTLMRLEGAAEAAVRHPETSMSITCGWSRQAFPTAFWRGVGPVKNVFIVGEFH